MDYTDTRPPEAEPVTPDWQVTTLYQAHALSLARLALLMLGNADAAQDALQDAFLGLYRRWDKLASAEAAPDYADPEQMNRFTWYQAHDWKVPYPGDSKIYAPSQVPGAYLPSSDTN